MHLCLLPPPLLLLLLLLLLRRSHCGLLHVGGWRRAAVGLALQWRALPRPQWRLSVRRCLCRRPHGRRFPGSGPLSEPETRWFVDEINAFAPDVIVTVHAPEGVVDYDGPKDGPHRLGRLYLNLIGTYPGSLGNYAGIQRRIPVVTIELPYARTMPNVAEVADIWRDLVQWLMRNVPMRLPMAGKDAQETEPS